MSLRHGDHQGLGGPSTVAREDVEALRKSPVLSEVSTPNLERLLEVAEIKRLQPGETLFSEGDLTSRLYLVKAGVIQILRPDPDTAQVRAMVHLKRGDVLCDVGLFTGVRHRSSAVAVDNVEVLMIEASEVRQLFRSNYHLAHQFAAGLAHALTATRTLLEASKGTSMTLKGSLKGVDLLGLVHTLASCEDLAGHIVIHDDRHDTVGEVTIKEAHIVAASMGRIVGDEAFYELMLSAPADGGFSFREAGRETRAGIQRNDAVQTPTAHLVLEAMRVRDELARFRAVYDLPNVKVQPKPGAQLVFNGPDLGLAMKLWSDLQCGRTPSDLVKGAAIMKQLKVFGVIHCLVESGQATLTSSPA